MTKSANNLLWIVGQGGLLGSSIATQVNQHSNNWILWKQPEAFCWTEPLLLKNQFEHHLDLFLQAVKKQPKWTLIWTAGAGVVGTSAENLRAETSHFKYFLNQLEKKMGSYLNQGSFFLASSAGGIWAGCPHFPVNEATPPHPISDYGKQKLEQEQILKALSKTSPQFRVMIGRISNLYGTRQNLTKTQGLLSQLCRSALLQVPMNVFVPLSTVRDYLYAPDAAELILRALKKMESTDQTLTTKIFASEEECSISQILSHLAHLTHHEPRMAYPENTSSSLQPLELSFRSQVLIEPYSYKPLLEGLNEILNFQESKLQLGELPFPQAI
ncbi:MAG: NAD-dependent epimerase/dehydratase family protein [Deltaproteobacteria bacterium]